MPVIVTEPTPGGEHTVLNRHTWHISTVTIYSLMHFDLLIFWL